MKFVIEILFLIITVGTLYYFFVHNCQGSFCFYSNDENEESEENPRPTIRITPTSGPTSGVTTAPTIGNTFSPSPTTNRITVSPSPTI